MLPNAFEASPTMAGSCSAICWPMTASWFCASAFGARLDRVRLGHALRLDRGALRLADRLGGVGLRLAVLARRDGVRLGRELHALGVGLGAELDLARLRLGLRDARVALGLGDRARLVRLGVGRLAHGGLQVLLGLCRLELGDLRLLHDDLLTRRRVGERAGLLGDRLRLVRLGDRLRLPDLRRAARRRLQRLGVLLALGRLAVGLGLRDARLLGDARRLGRADVRDVAGLVVDLLDLQRVDRQPELLHLDRRRLARLGREPVARADHLLDRHRADDRAQVPGEDVVDERVHLVFLLEEAPRRVRDRRVVVGDLVDHDRLDPDRDALRRHAVDVELDLVQVERQRTRPLEDRDARTRRARR